MSFDYSCINLDALAATPKGCSCSDKEKSEAMKQYLLDKFKNGEVERIQVGGKKFKIEEIVFPRMKQ